MNAFVGGCGVVRLAGLSGCRSGFVTRRSGLKVAVVVEGRNRAVVRTG